MTRMYPYATRLVLGLGLITLFALSPSAHAALLDRGEGMIYDTDLNITWLQDASYVKQSSYYSDGHLTWHEATAWADGLVYGGFDDWRLPTIDPSVAGIASHNYTNGEYAHLWYVELGNPVWGSNYGPFLNVEMNRWWSSTELGSIGAWTYILPEGSQTAWTYVGPDASYMAWGVRNGDVVPEPSSVLMLIVGPTVILGVRRRHRSSR